MRLRIRRSFGLAIFAFSGAFGGGMGTPARAEGFALKPAPSAILVAPADAGKNSAPRRPTEDELAPPEEPEASPSEPPAESPAERKAPEGHKERIEYTVAAGDTLGGIAYRHGI